MILLALAALSVQAATAPAQATAVAICKADLPRELRAWPAAHPVAHGFAIGRAVNLPVVPLPNVRLAVQPSKPLSGEYLATASFEVKLAGTYRVAAGGARVAVKPLWLDIAGADGKPLASAAHTHGPTCSSITKVVEYNLTPGRYTLLVTALTARDAVRVLLVKK